MIDILFEFFRVLFQRMVDIVLAPVNHPDMIWIIIPLLVSVFFMELYFGRYPREEMGYHMALENTIFLFFVSVDLIRHILLEHSSSTPIKVFLVGTIITYAVAMAILDFFHKLPRNIAYRISSKSLVGFTAYIGIVLIYSDILKDLTETSVFATLCAVIIIFFLYNLFMSSIRYMQPKHHDEVDEILRSVEKDLSETAKELKR